MLTEQRNGAVWTDTAGAPLHAHGGTIIKVGDTYYWYGEDRRENYYVSCYRSKDLINWKFVRHSLTTESPMAKTRVRATLNLGNSQHKVNLERPKVLYNPQTKQYVMWLHYENGVDYREASAAVATAASPEDEFTYHGSFHPFGFMSRDCTLFQDDDGAAYFISTARDNADMHIYRLSDDYLNVQRLVNRLWNGEYREAPALFKQNGRYYMLSSFCTGWAPNQGQYASADRIDGDWTDLVTIGDKTTYGSQPTFVLPVIDQLLYWGDRWNAEDYDQSGYVVYPLSFQDQRLIMTPNDSFALPVPSRV